MTVEDEAEFLGPDRTGNLVEACSGAALIVAGQMRGTADLLLDKGALSEDCGETDVAWRTAFIVATLVWGVATFETADHITVTIRAIAADRLIASAGAGARITTECAVGTAFLARTGSGRRRNRRRSRRWRRSRNGGAGANPAGVDLVGGETAGDGNSAEPEEALDDRSS